MTLAELQRIVNGTIDRLPSYQKPEDITVIITLAHKSMGERSGCGVKAAFRGMDFERQQFRIEPHVELFRKVPNENNS